MTQQFGIQRRIQGVALADFKRLAMDTTLHEVICRRIPGENLEILQSKIVGHLYTLERAYNLDVNIPNIAKKFLKDAFRIQRIDIVDLEQMTSTVDLAANLPLDAHCQRFVTGCESILMCI